MGGRSVAFALIVLLMGARNVEPSKDTMKMISSGFVKVLDECKREMNLTDSVFVDLFHFWKLEYDLLNRDTGCMMICMSKKLDLIDATGKLHHGNTQEFAKKHGAGDEMAVQLVNALHGCEKLSESEADDCVRALEMSKCFRTKVHELNWTPKVEYIVEEVLTEI